MITRKGKIARLPEGVLEELNRRLDEGESGVQLVEWLNQLPEVKQVLDAEFDGRPISEMNISDWKQGGFIDWQTQREMMAGVEKLRADGKALSEASAEVADDMQAVVLARYANIIHGATGELSKEMEGQLKYLSKSLRDLVRFRRCRQAERRTDIQEETLELKRQKTEEGQRKVFMELVKDPKILAKITPKMTAEEKAAAISKILFPNGL